MQNWIYPNEARLRLIALLIAIPLWVLLMVGTVGIALLYLLAAWVFYLFAHSALITHLRGHAVEVTPAQFPDLHARLERCCASLQLKTVPTLYLLHGNGIFNAFATRFLGRDYLVLLSDLVDALDERPEAIDFYIGHELGHVRQRHLLWGVILAPALFLPLLGAAYSRAREYTCDRHGLACCASPEDALRGLAALAAGHRRWRDLNLAGYVSQAADGGGFWMSLHEFVADYPWLTKRAAWLRALAEQREPVLPGRSALAGLLALFVPRVPGAGGSSFIVVVAMIGVLAAIAIPAYQDYVMRARILGGLNAGRPYEAAVLGYVQKNNKWPTSNDEAALNPQPLPPGIQDISIGAAGVVTIRFAGKPLDGAELLLEPYIRDQRLNWRCHGESLKPKWLPPECR